MAQQPNGIPGTAPEVLPGSKFSVTVSATDFILGIGKTRLIYDAEGKIVGQGVEYTHSFSLSATSAKQMAKVLSLAIERYTKEFGQIPDDPTVEKKLLASFSAPKKSGRVVPIKRAVKRSK